jgi:hypothetical protein
MSSSLKLPAPKQATKAGQDELYRLVLSLKEK